MDLFSARHARSLKGFVLQVSAYFVQVCVASRPRDDLSNRPQCYSAKSYHLRLNRPIRILLVSNQCREMQRYGANPNSMTPFYLHRRFIFQMYISGSTINFLVRCGWSRRVTACLYFSAGLGVRFLISNYDYKAIAAPPISMSNDSKRPYKVNGSFSYCTALQF